MCSLVREGGPSVVHPMGSVEARSLARRSYGDAINIDRVSHIGGASMIRDPYAEMVARALLHS